MMRIEFELECIDKLGVLEYKLFPDLLKDEQGNMNKSYKTPREFIKLALEKVVEFSGINYSIDYDELNGTKIDHTTDTKINPQIFIGESKDDWMTCKEALEEIGKIYGCFFWQDGDICYVKNVLVYDLKNPYQLKKEDYMGDDANISVDTAYNLIKCEVDISSIDSDFINPFDKDAIQATTKWPERILTEFVSNGRGSDSLIRFADMLLNPVEAGNGHLTSGRSCRSVSFNRHSLFLPYAMPSNSSMFLESALSFTTAFFQEAVLPMG